MVRQKMVSHIHIKSDEKAVNSVLLPKSSKKKISGFEGWCTSFFNHILLINPSSSDFHLNKLEIIEEMKQKKFLTVAPFECAWRDDLRFREAGRGCVAFEAFALNDVTVVFREHVGSQHYHYKRDNTRHYTVIIGSHRNRRLKIEVDGNTVVDEAGVGLCCSSAFQSYWISLYDGLISIGKGRYPFQNLVFQWLDTNPNCSVQYVGLSSWDKHVGYRNVNVLPLKQSLWKQMDCFGSEGDDDDNDENRGYETWGLEKFVENWDLSDMFFVVGKGERAVPGHKVILAASGNFDEDVIQLEDDVTYSVLHAFLQYIYTGRTQISEPELSSLRSLSLRFEVNTLVKQCDEMMERFKVNKKIFEWGKNVEILYPSSQPHSGTTFPGGLPLSKDKLKEFQLDGKYSDIDIYVEGREFSARSHKVILSLWSAPFTKMFTNGMSESISSDVCLKDVGVEAFKGMLDFMYTGDLSNTDDENLLQILLLADQFDVSILHQECCKLLLECLSEDSVCPILQVISSYPWSKLIREACESKFAMHFDYCTTANVDFVSLDEPTFTNILQHQDLTVTSEERVLNSVLIWCLKAPQVYGGWEAVDDMLSDSTPPLVFGERLTSLDNFLSLVRFPLLPLSLLKNLEGSNLCKKMLGLNHMVTEAISFLEAGLARPVKDPRFEHRRSSYKELQYISDGDSNGILYYAGTSYGQHQWVNPVLAKRINITASSPTSRFTDPKVLASRSYQGTSFAGSRIEDGTKTSWWMVDVGPDHQVMCNYYTLRMDGSKAFIRSWNFQGSSDGKNWTNLRVHENDQKMCKSAQFGSWPIKGPNALLPFRYFRVALTAPTTDDRNPWAFCICFLELYGHFR